MAHVKYVRPSGWDFGVPTVSRVKLASGDLRGHDRKEFIKRAAGSENVFLPFLDKIKFADDEEPVHQLALGAHETWGSNRNGDSFRRSTCQKNHDTFVKFARAFRNHRNKIPEKSYGIVKLSVYNPLMDRIELLVALNKTKTAAQRNGGLVADEELDDLDKHGMYDISMACRVPLDKCSFCGNEARTRDEYCTAEKCAAGGCKENLSRLVKVGNDVHHLHVENPDPTWFDISRVFRGADRIAKAAPADYMRKCAEDVLGDGWVPAAVISHQAPLDRRLWGPAVVELMKLAHALDALHTVTSAVPPPAARLAFVAQPSLDFTALGIDPSDVEKCAGALNALADRKVVLPLREYARLSGREHLATDAATAVPEAFARMTADGTLEARVAGDSYCRSAAAPSESQRVMAAKVARNYSLEKAAVDERATRRALHSTAAPKNVFCAAAVCAPEAEALSRDYALYKLAALRRMSCSCSADELLLTAVLCDCQNLA